MCQHIYRPKPGSVKDVCVHCGEEDDYDYEAEARGDAIMFGGARHPDEMGVSEYREDTDPPPREM